MSLLTMVRSGETEWSKKKQITGWVDVPLSDNGVQDVLDCGKVLMNIPVDVIYTSTLIRAQMTLFLAMLNHSSNKTPILMHLGQKGFAKASKIYSKEAMQNIIPVHSAMELNARMYGKLQGKSQEESIEAFGDEEFHQWMSSFDIPAPDGESFEMTAQRTIPYFENNIVPHLRDGRNVFLVAHYNTLKTIIMDLRGLSKDEAVNLDIPKAKLITYEFKHGCFTEIDAHSIVLQEEIHE